MLPPNSSVSIYVKLIFIAKLFYMTKTINANLNLKTWQ